MLVGRGYIDFVCNKATIPHFIKEKLANVPFPVFSEQETREICDYIDVAYRMINDIIADKEQLIRDLELYKRYLIYEAVTGKRKVV